MANIQQLIHALTAQGFSPPAEVLPGVAPEAFEAFERTTGLRLPAAVRDLYSYSAEPFADWLAADKQPMPPLIERFHSFRPWNEVQTWWAFLRELEKSAPDNVSRYAEPEDAIRRTSFSKSWIPIGRDVTSSEAMVDLDPGPAGSEGQLILNIIDAMCRVMLAPSLASYFDDLIHCLNAGLIVARHGEWQTPVGGSVDSLQEEIERAGGR
jgi:cell wall assembly regulator SMI1